MSTCTGVIDLKPNLSMMFKTESDKHGVISLHAAAILKFSSQEAAILLISTIPLNDFATDASRTQSRQGYKALVWARIPAFYTSAEVFTFNGFKMSEKEKNVFLAKLAEQAERYDGKEIVFDAISGHFGC